jgi:hypothetical protein
MRSSRAADRLAGHRNSAGSAPKYRRVIFSATFENAKEALVFAAPFGRAPKLAQQCLTIAGK